MVREVNDISTHPQRHNGKAGIRAQVPLGTALSVLTFKEAFGLFMAFYKEQSRWWSDDEESELCGRVLGCLVVKSHALHLS